MEKSKQNYEEEYVNVTEQGKCKNNLKKTLEEQDGLNQYLQKQDIYGIREFDSLIQFDVTNFLKRLSQYVQLDSQCTDTVGKLDEIQKLSGHFKQIYISLNKIVVDSKNNNMNLTRKKKKKKITDKINDNIQQNEEEIANIPVYEDDI